MPDHSIHREVMENEGQVHKKRTKKIPNASQSLELEVKSLLLNENNISWKFIYEIMGYWKNLHESKSRYDEICRAGKS